MNGDEERIIKNVRLLFPPDLEQLLSFEEPTFYVTPSFKKTDEEHMTICFEEMNPLVIARPRRSLDTDNLLRLVHIVMNEGGEVVSAGKLTHFRIPVKKWYRRVRTSIVNEDHCSLG